MDPEGPSHTRWAPSPFSFGHAQASASSILVVDADADTRALYREALAFAGCAVVEAGDGREALVKALLRRPSLVITEIRLPFIDGYELCEVLRRDRATADVPILVVTTEARPAQIGRARRAGADIVLIKPAPIERIVAEMRRLTASATEPGERDEPENGSGRSEPHRIRSRSFARLTTTTPPSSPPILRCPSCDRLLTYERSEIGGVSHHHREQWDYYGCDPCGSFQHRQRTRKLRQVS